MRNILLGLMLFASAVAANAQRSSIVLDKGWKFLKGEHSQAVNREFDDRKWESVSIPHDWAVYGPFDRENDLQKVQVTQNMEAKASVKTGRTGGLPYVGTGWYRRFFNTKAGKQVTLLFDGAMSEAQVYVNGQKVCFWPYGYNSFYCDITDFLNKDGRDNLLAVRLENRPQSSRWYPGAGLYRNVHLIETEKIHVPVWGTQITTPKVEKEYAAVQLKTKIVNVEKEWVTVNTKIIDNEGRVVAHRSDKRRIFHGEPFEQNFIVEHPMLWSPEQPVRYKAVSEILVDGKRVDEYTTDFGIRTVEFVAGKGFYLNGMLRKFKGVCNHHDLGPLGAAVNVSALRHQLTLLKNMGCDAIRTSHNMPAPELVELCDEMGFMMMIEPFDEWDVAKCENGYHRYFKEWAEKDMINMLHNYRNHPCVALWSIGNEVPTQCSKEGYKVAKFLQDICHREDPTRSVTCGMDMVDCVLGNGFAAMIDIPGFNYRDNRYLEGYRLLPQNFLLGSETASTVSSRGVYMFPVEKKKGATYENHQCSGYDVECCPWSNLPDEDFALADDYDWTLGQFVWTGFDYLGEPSPYDTDAWPSHSSVFGIIDLASLPKDRYYLYRSVWNTKEKTLHILPHWTWPGREGKQTPVFVYSNYPEVELFVNGKSYGKRHRLSKEESDALKGKDPFAQEKRYRLMWMDVVYQPGELRAVAYDEKGNRVEEKVVKTAGKPYALKMETDRRLIASDGKDLSYITVSVVDKEGNLCPADGRLIRFTVNGSGVYRAGANGDASCLDLFHLPEMHAFAGQMTAIVQNNGTKGKISVKATAKGVKSAKIELEAE